MKHDKLVRDKIPEIIRERGALPVTHIASDTEYQKRLKDKLKEEVNEFLEDTNEEELADILEVVYALGESIGVSKEKLEQVRRKKAIERGEFKAKIILEETKE